MSGRVRAIFTGRPTTCAAIAASDVVRVRAALRAEAAADELRHHADVGLRQTEDRRDALAAREHALRGVVEREPAAVPGGRGGVRFHRVVELGRRHVGLVDADRRRRERGVERAARRVGRILIRLGRLVRSSRPASSSSSPAFAAYVTRTRARGVGRDLERLGDDQRDRLAVVEHAIVLQQAQFAVAGRSRVLAHTRRIVGGQNRQNAAQRARLGASIDVTRPAAIVLVTMTPYATFADWLFIRGSARRR